MPTDRLIFLILPCYLFGFLSFVFCRNRLRKGPAGGFSILLNALGLGLAVQIWFDFETSQHFTYNWIDLGRHQFACDLLVNQLTVMMLVLVQSISLLVQVFSIRYLRNEPRIVLYFAYLNLFVFSMLGLVLSGNLMLMFMFWELVGFCSYLLIGFWYKRESASRASLKAFLMNRLGDAGFLIGIGLVYTHFGTLDLQMLGERVLAMVTPADTTWMALCFFAGCMGKSAQFPLQTWLPDAMEGPTPASALIHAATMVAAGIFLLARLEFLITPAAGAAISAIGAFTALLAAYSAIFQSDIKKVLAFSTVSQLGLMVMALGAGETNFALFHLFTHAFFKAGLFLIAGAAIDYFHHEQNMFKMGGLLRNKPVWGVAYLICGGALAGLPLSSGYLSKDAIILGTYNWSLMQGNRFYLLIPLMGFSASVMTAFYVTRQFVLVFLGKGEHKAAVQGNFHFSAFEWGIIPLALASLSLLHSQNPLVFEKAFFGQWLPFSEQHNHWVTYSLLAFVFVAIAFSYWLFAVKRFTFTENIWSKMGLKHFAIDSFYLQKLVPLLVGTPKPENNEKGFKAYTNRGFAHLLFLIDQRIIDGLVRLLVSANLYLARLSHALDQHLVDGLVTTVSAMVSGCGLRLKRIQNGRVQSYLITLVLAMIALSLVLSLC